MIEIIKPLIFFIAGIVCSGFIFKIKLMQNAKPIVYVTVGFVGGILASFFFLVFAFAKGGM